MQSTGQRTRCIYQRSVSANDLIAESSSHYYFTPSHDDIRGSHFALCDFVSRWQTSSKSLQRFLYGFSFASALDHLVLPATIALYLIPFSQVSSFYQVACVFPFQSVSVFSHFAFQSMFLSSFSQSIFSPAGSLYSDSSPSFSLHFSLFMFHSLSAWGDSEFPHIPGSQLMI
jgi:hypothetical protein